jgi:hypothetical protein
VGKTTGKGKQIAQYSTRPITRETTGSSKDEAVFSDDKGYYSAEPEKLQEILCFFTCFSLYLQERLQNSGDEFVETKRGFCWEHVPSQKPLSVFTQQSHFNRFKFIFEAYFSEKATGNTLFFTCFSLYLQERLQNRWR